MRIANRAGRAVLIVDGTTVDVEKASDGRFGPDPAGVYEQWAEFSRWASFAEPAAGDPYTDSDLETPVPRPRQIFAIGPNYRDHADEAGLDHPESIVVFTKFASSLAGPASRAVVSSDSVDYEAELVVVIGQEAHKVSVDDAAEVVAGFSVDQIISDLSQVVTLYPGDLIFTGTPAGVGMARGVSIRAGDVVTTTIEGIGSITTEFAAG